MPTFIDYGIPKIKRIDGLPQGRLYETPSGVRYPSVTTVVGSIGDKSYLIEWRAKVGDAVANKITQDASRRGTLLHERCENFLLGQPVEFTIYQHIEREMFSYFLPVLKSIEEIHALETTLWSDKIKVAGTVDLIAKHDGVLKVIDWKNARRYKSKEEIPGYFAQMAAYAYMFYERTGVVIPRIMVVITVEDYGLVTYEEDVRDHLPVFLSARKQFDKI
jgi:genome maintenance exonuclease 1